MPLTYSRPWGKWPAFPGTGFLIFEVDRISSHKWKWKGLSSNWCVPGIQREKVWCLWLVLQNPNWSTQKPEWSSLVRSAGLMHWIYTDWPQEPHVVFLIAIPGRDRSLEYLTSLSRSFNSGNFGGNGTKSDYWFSFQYFLSCYPVRFFNKKKLHIFTVLLNTTHSFNRYLWMNSKSRLWGCRGKEERQGSYS